MLMQPGLIEKLKQRMAINKKQGNIRMLPCRLPKSNQTLHQILTMKQPYIFVPFLCFNYYTNIRSIQGSGYQQ